MKVFLIRHAESEENALNYDARISRADFNAVLQRSFESPLTTRGEQQAGEVIQRLEHERIARLYCSPMQRALATATILGTALDCAPVILNDLREVMPNMQSERGRPASLRRHFIYSYTKMAWPFSKNETFASAYRRTRRIWKEITAEPAEEIAAVSHRGTIGVLLFSLQRSRNWRVTRQDLSNGGVSIVVSRDT